MRVKIQEKIPITEEEERLQNQHLREKLFMRAEKDRDKESITESSLLVVFDLENVITLPNLGRGGGGRKGTWLYSLINISGTSWCLAL